MFFFCLFTTRCAPDGCYCHQHYDFSFLFFHVIESIKVHSLHFVLKPSGVRIFYHSFVTTSTIDQPTDHTMTSVTAKKPCTKCNKGGVTTCDGCQQSFCIKHFNEHRQELGVRMDEVGQERDVLRQDLSREDGTHPLLSHVDKWERESIIKIQVAAEAARAGLRQVIDQAKSELKTSIGKMTEEFQSSRESDDCTEIDLKRWIDELDELRKKLEAPLAVEIAGDIGDPSFIRLIKIKDQQQSSSSTRVNSSFKQSIHALQQPVQLAREHFNQVVGHAALSDDGLVATCTRYHKGMSSVICGTNRYSSGTHHIRFLIEQKRAYCLFFGIVGSSQEVSPSFLCRSEYGCWDLDDRVVNGQRQPLDFRTKIKVDDEVTLTLDCDNRQIQLLHHRTSKFVLLPIDLRMCPFPWKFLLRLNSQGDRIRVVS